MKTRILLYTRTPTMTMLKPKIYSELLRLCQISQPNANDAKKIIIVLTPSKVTRNAAVTRLVSSSPAWLKVKVTKT